MRKELSLKSYLIRLYVILGAFLLASAVVLAICFALYGGTQNITILIVGSFVSLGLLAIDFIVLFVLARQIYDLFYKNLFETTRENFNAFLNRKTKYRKYNQSLNLVEFATLNNEIDSLGNAIKYTTITMNLPNYSDLGLTYLNDTYNVVALDALVKNYRNLIISAKSFRNAFIEFNFANKQDKYNDKFDKQVIDEIEKNLAYKGLVIGKKEDEHIYLVFAPIIDSISRLQEEITSVVKNCAVCTNETDAIEITMGRANLVVYPFSDIDNIMNDLRYAAKQGQIINVHLPTKIVSTTNDNLLDTSMNLNNVSKTINALAPIQNSSNTKKDLESIARALKNLIGYLNIDECGIIAYDQNIEKYRAILCLSTSEKEAIFAKNKDVSETFIYTLDSCKDEDGSYYFSNRAHCNAEFGKLLDIYGIESGHFFIGSGTSRPIGLIYFINRDSGFFFNSYIREQLLVASSFITHYLQKRDYAESITSMERRISSLSKLSNLTLYSIDSSTYSLTHFSETIKDRNNAKIGDKCYNCLYGRDTPCKDCPLLTGKKKVIEFNGTEYETSLTLYDKTSKEVELLITRNTSDVISHDRFDTDFLTNSYYSFIERMKGLFYNQSKGYIVTLTITNYQNLYKEFGNESFSRLIRAFTNRIIEQLPSLSNVYLFHDNVFLLVLPELGRVNVVNDIEKIYEMSKEEYFEENGKVPTLDISYEAIRYPQSFATEKDLMRYVDKYLLELKIRDTDQVHYEENDFIRPASRKQFILQVLENAVTNHTLTMLMQPIVKVSNTHMQAAEILIRLNDNDRNLVFNTFEMIKVASENDKIGIISDILIDFIGQTYTKYGNTFFKSFGFTRLSLNTDYSYFAGDFLTKIENMLKESKLPKHFLGFEINEPELMRYFDAFKALSKTLLKYDVVLICDQYTGEHLTLNKLKEIGISEVKISRSMVKDIDINPDKLNSVISTIKSAAQLDIKTCLVGVENKEQYQLIKKENLDCLMQGFYFSQPLETNDLLETLRKSNS